MEREAAAAFKNITQGLAMTKKLMINIFIIISIITAFLSVTACSANNIDEITGSWYNLRMQELILTEDGIFSYEDEGGTYTYENGKIILIANRGETTVLEVSYDDNDMILNDTSTNSQERKTLYRYDIAYELYCEAEQKAQDGMEAKTEEFRNYFVGTWTGDNINGAYLYTLTIHDDNTYTLEAKLKDGWYDDGTRDNHSGVWEFVKDEKTPDEKGRMFFRIYDEQGEVLIEKFFYIPNYSYDEELDNIMLIYNQSRFYKSSERN